MKSSIDGLNNSIEIDATVDIDNVSSISIKGSNNKIVIKKNTVLRNAHFIMESDYNIVVIAENCRITGRYIQKIVDNNVINIGAGTTFGVVHIICGEGKKVFIGDDCMFAFDITFRTTDSHAIIDKNSKERLNFGEDIIIGSHVWIAAHSEILKGSEIKGNSVVASKSLVSSKFTESGVVIGGVPAKIIRRGITWERPLLG